MLIAGYIHHFHIYISYDYTLPGSGDTAGTMETRRTADWETEWVIVGLSGGGVRIHRGVVLIIVEDVIRPT